jgi:hypothetical protein
MQMLVVLKKDAKILFSSFRPIQTYFHKILVVVFCGLSIEVSKTFLCHLKETNKMYLSQQLLNFIHNQIEKKLFHLNFQQKLNQNCTEPDHKAITF